MKANGQAGLRVLQREDGPGRQLFCHLVSCAIVDSASASKAPTYVPFLPNLKSHSRKNKDVVGTIGICKTRSETGVARASKREGREERRDTTHAHGRIIHEERCSHSQNMPLSMTQRYTKGGKGSLTMKETDYTHEKKKYISPRFLLFSK